MTTQIQDPPPQQPLQAVMIAMIHYLRDIERMNWKLTEKRLAMLEDEIIAMRAELESRERTS